MRHTNGLDPRGASHEFVRYCKTLNICGIKISRFNKYEILAQFNFGVHDLPWFQFDVNCNIFSFFYIKLYIVASIRIASSRRF